MSLTEDDKQWFATQLDTKLEAVGTRLDAKLESLETRFDMKLEALETRLLRDFHDWASPVEMRVRSHAAALRALDIEVESLDSRVSKIELPH